MAYEESRQELSRGLRTAVPIVIGYFPIAMTFGLIARNMDIGILPACAMSLFVFAGASQFMALNMIMSGISAVEIVIATLLVNFRHFLMSASLSTRLPRNTRCRHLIAFWLTDETFAVASGNPGEVSGPYLLGLESLAYLSWVCGTAVGHGVGQILPMTLQRSMGISLYALFVGLLVLGVKRSIRAVPVALTAALSHLLLDSIAAIPSGWSIILAVIIGSIVGAFVLGEEK